MDDKDTERLQTKLFWIAVKVGVSPKLIETRLLSLEDKKDILNGRFTDEELEAHVRAWVSGGKPCMV